MYFSISGKLRCGVYVNFKPPLVRPILTENLSITAKPEKTHLYVCHTLGPIKHENCWLFLLQRQRFQNKIMKEILIVKISFSKCATIISHCAQEEPQSE